MSSSKDLEENRDFNRSNNEENIRPTETLHESGAISSIKVPPTELSNETTSSPSSSSPPSYSIWNGFERFGQSLLNTIENIGESVASMFGFVEHNFDDILEDLTDEERQQIFHDQQQQQQQQQHEENQNLASAITAGVDDKETAVLMEKMSRFASLSSSSSTSYVVDGDDIIGNAKNESTLISDTRL